MGKNRLNQIKQNQQYNMNFKLCMALAIISFSAYARGDGKLIDECSEHDRLCREGRHLEKSDIEYECNVLDEMGLCKGGRRLGRAESGDYELEEAERDDCTEEDGCEHEESEDEGERRLAGGSVNVERDGKCRGRGCRRLNDS